MLISKNVEIERAVEDLLDAVSAYTIDSSITKPSEADKNKVRLFYCNSVYEALLACAKGSLNALKTRISAELKKRESTSSDKKNEIKGGDASAGAGGAGDTSAGGVNGGENDAGDAPEVDKPLFDIDVSLQVPNVCFNPTLNEVQEAIDTVAHEVLESTRKLTDWGVETESEIRRNRISFYDQVVADEQLAAVLLMLSGTVEQTKKTVESNLIQYKKYEWLWMKEPESEYANFVAKNNPILDDFIAELHRFVAVEEEIASLSNSEDYGALNLRNENFKLQLKHEIERWKFQYSEKLHQEAKHDMEGTSEMMKDLKNKLEREVKDFASLKYVMDAQSELREIQAGIEIRFKSILDRYNTLEKYLPFGALSKDEMDAKSVLRTDWNSILIKSEQVMGNVSILEGPYREDLIDKVSVFQKNVKSFREDYDANGPMVQGIAPQEAMTRLNKFKREFIYLTAILAKTIQYSLKSMS